MTAKAIKEQLRRLRIVTRDIVFRALVFLTVAVIAVGFSWNHPEQKHKNDGHQTTQNYGERSDDKIADYTWWLTFFTAVLGGVSVVQIYFLSRSDETARLAAEAARDSADAVISTERPFLHISKIGIDIGDAPSANYSISNFGRTPAILSKTKITLRCATEIPGFQNTLIPNKRWRDRVIYEREEISDLTADLPRQDLANYGLMRGIEINDGGDTFALYFIAHLEYADVFGKVREAGFAYMILWGGLDGHLLSKCGGDQYNYDREKKGS